MTARAGVTLGSERHATSGPSPYSQDLSAGLCVGDWDFPDLPQAAQWATCIQCPVRARCWAAAEEPDESLLLKTRTRRRRGESWATICADLDVSHVELWRKLAAAGEGELAESVRRSAGWWGSALPEVERLHDQGLTGAEIADRLGYDRPKTLMQALYRCDRAELWRHDRRTRVDLYVEAIDGGATVGEVAARWSISATSVKEMLRRAGRLDLAQHARPRQVVRGNQYGRWSA